MATDCQDRANKLEDKIGQKSYQLIVTQIWALLPGFCNNPKDLNQEVFESVVKDLGKNLKNPDLRMSIMAGLRQLVLKNLETNRKVLSKWAPKFLMELRNLYTIKPVKEGQAVGEKNVMFYYQRDSVMETIKLLLQLVDSSELYDQVYDAYFNPEK